MSEKARKILWLLAPGIVLAIIFYIIIPLALPNSGVDLGLQSGICLSLILIVAGGILGGMHTSDVMMNGAMYADRVLTHSTEAMRKQNRKLLIPLINLGTYIGGIGVLLLLLGILAYMVLK